MKIFNLYLIIVFKIKIRDNYYFYKYLLQFGKILLNIKSLKIRIFIFKYNYYKFDKIDNKNFLN